MLRGTLIVSLSDVDAARQSAPRSWRRAIVSIVVIISATGSVIVRSVPPKPQRSDSTSLANGLRWGQSWRLGSLTVSNAATRP